MSSSQRLLKHVRLVLMCFVLSLLSSGAAPLVARALSLDPSVCSAAQATSAQGSEQGAAMDGSAHCALCLPVGLAVPPKPVRWDVRPIAIAAQPLQPRAPPLPQRWSRPAQARAPPLSLT
jgi:hypothetical protein